jgi:predicted enzyme related to lactoylglutathione lyase
MPEFPKPVQQFKEMAGAPSRWTSYFAVTDCDATVKKAGQLGATVLVPATDIPQVGRFAAFADPQGAAFSVIKGEPASD